MYVRVYMYIYIYTSAYTRERIHTTGCATAASTDWLARAPPPRNSLSLSVSLPSSHLYSLICIPPRARSLCGEERNLYVGIDIYVCMGMRERGESGKAYSSRGGGVLPGIYVYYMGGYKAGVVCGWWGSKRSGAATCWPLLVGFARPSEEELTWDRSGK